MIGLQEDYVREVSELMYLLTGLSSGGWTAGLARDWDPTWEPKVPWVGDNPTWWEILGDQKSLQMFASWKAENDLHLKPLEIHHHMRLFIVGACFYIAPLALLPVQNWHCNFLSAHWEIDLSLVDEILPEAVYYLFVISYNWIFVDLTKFDEYCEMSLHWPSLPLEFDEKHLSEALQGLLDLG